MAVKKVKPTTPGRRSAKYDDFSDITKVKPEKSLITIKKKRGGRNAQGKITVRHRGGGAKRYIRKIDYKRIYKENIKFSLIISLKINPHGFSLNLSIIPHDKSLIF